MHPTDGEQERRCALLQTGHLSDLHVQALGHTFHLHSFIVSVRCGYFWSQLDRSWSPLQPQTLTFELPTALDEDGPWSRRDLDTFWSFVYTTEAHWLTQWQHHQTACAMGGLTLQQLQHWLRLHRLAHLFAFTPLITSIEELLLTAGLQSWTTHTRFAQTKTLTVDGSDEAGRGVLVPRLTALLRACHADLDGRWRLGRSVVLWALTIAPTLFPQPSIIRSEWAQELRDSPFTSTLISQPNTRVFAVCEHCFECTNPARDTHERIRLLEDNQGGWSVIRPRPNRKASVPWMLSPDQAQTSAIEYLHLDVARMQSSTELTLTCDPGAFGTWYTVPSTLSSCTLPLRKDWRGCCQQCKTLTDKLHIFALRPVPPLASPQSPVAV